MKVVMGSMELKKILGLKGYCTIFPLLPENFRINQSSWEKHIAENPITKFLLKL